MTTARVALLHALEQASGPRTATALAQALSGCCDRPTVYRNLRTLADAGLVSEIGRMGGQTWFSGGVRPVSSALFFCDGCGCAYALRARLDVQEPRWREALAAASTWVSGTCPGCAGGAA